MLKNLFSKYVVKSNLLMVSCLKFEINGRPIYNTTSIPIYKTQLPNPSRLRKVVNLVDSNKFVLNLYTFPKIPLSLMLLSLLNAC